MNLEAWKNIGDWHTQTIAHGTNEPLLVNETVEAARRLGLQRICLTDHYPLPPEFVDPTKEKDCSMSRALYFGTYLKRVDEVRNNSKGEIEVLSGAEFDWLSDYKTWTREEIKKRPYDYCIGSVHFLRDSTGTYQILDYTEDVFRQVMNTFGGIGKLVQTYYSEVRSMVTSGLFDGVGHMDLIKKYSNAGNPMFDENEAWYKKEVTETLQAIKKNRMSIEINTAGWQKKCQAPYPSKWILEEACRLGIPLTIGSDGHKPEEIGRDLDRAVQLAYDVGYRSIAIYRKRNRTELPI